MGATTEPSTIRSGRPGIGKGGAERPWLSRLPERQWTCRLGAGGPANLQLLREETAQKTSSNEYKKVQSNCQDGTVRKAQWSQDLMRLGKNTEQPEEESKRRRTRKQEQILGPTDKKDEGIRDRDSISRRRTK